MSDVHILKSGILVVFDTEIFMLYWDGTQSDTLKIDIEMARLDLALEDKNGIYLYKKYYEFSDIIHKINKEFDKEEVVLSRKDAVNVDAVGLEKDINGKLDGSEKNRLEYKKDDWIVN